MSGPFAALDTGWLQDILGRAGHDAKAVTLLSADPVGVGNTSEVARLVLTSPAALPSSLIAKMPRVMPDGSTPPAELFGYDREVAAYRFFGPATDFRVPRAYAVEQDESGFTLLLEDLGEGCRAGDQVAGCGIEDAEAVVAELAALHAAYWRSDAIHGLDWANRRWEFADRTSGMFSAGAATMRDRYSDHMPADALDLIDAAVPLIRAWASTEPFAATLIHADPRVDNIIFEAGGRACLIDLQSVSVGDAAFDLAYFLTGSVEPDARAAVERRLVNAHAATIRAVDPGYDDDLAWRRYRQFALSGLIATVSAAGLLGERAYIPQIVALARRNCAAIDALDGIAAAQDRIAKGLA